MNARRARLFWPAFGLLAAFSLLASARQARANGAFPDSLQILLPADRPDEMGLATNFGLILSDDHGQTWQWVCEGAALRSASLYLVGPPPLDRLYAVSSQGVVTSDDRACTWHKAGGAVGRVIATDVFAGPVSAERVLAIANPFDGMTIGPPGIYASMDGGVTFEEVLYRAAADDVLMGVEVAASAPDVIYAALYSSPGVHPKLLRTHDGGMSWETIDLEPKLGSAYVRIVAVDRSDPRRIFLRVQGSPGEELAVSDDGGDTFRRPVKVTGQLRGFAALPSGTIVVGGTSAGTTSAGVGFRSRDGGQTFQPWPNAPRVRALAARDGVLYIAADNFSNGYALATSTDEGDTITPIMKYADVSGAKSCVQAACDPSCAYEASLQVWPRTACVDAGVATAGPSKPAAGCGCALDDDVRPGTFALWLMAVLIAAGRARRFGDGQGRFSP
jgi:MYXO-CTERM domain-containing protein